MGTDAFTFLCIGLGLGPIHRGFELEDRLRADDQALVGDEVIGLGVDLVAIALHVDHRKAFASVVAPSVHQRRVDLAQFVYFVVGRRVNVFGEGFGLDGCHVKGTVFVEGVLKVALSTTEERGQNAGRWQVAILICHELGRTDRPTLEAQDVLARHYPRFEFVLVCADDLASFELEKLGMKRPPIKDDLVILQSV